MNCPKCRGELEKKPSCAKGYQWCARCLNTMPVRIKNETGCGPEQIEEEPRCRTKSI